MRRVPLDICVRTPSPVSVVGRSQYLVSAPTLHTVHMFVGVLATRLSSDLLLTFSLPSSCHFLRSTTWAPRL